MAAPSAGVAWIEVKPDMSGFESEVKKQTSGVGGVFDGIGKHLGVAVAAGAVVAGAAVAKFAFDSIGAASDLNETVSKVNTVFGDAGASIIKWSEGSAQAIGMSQQAALEAAGSFGNMFSQIGFGAGASQKMSQDLITMSADLASFNNIQGGAAAVTDMMSAAMRGEYDSLQAVIPTINAAAVEQRALADTGKANKDSLTAQEKAAATYSLIMEGAGAATGDFARTSDGLANQQRIMGANWENLSAKVGAVFLPMVTAAAGAVNTYLFPALAAFGDVLTTKALPAVQDFAERAKPAFEAFVGFITDTLVPAVQDFAGKVGPVITRSSRSSRTTSCPRYRVSTTRGGPSCRRSRASSSMMSCRRCRRSAVSSSTPWSRMRSPSRGCSWTR